MRVAIYARVSTNGKNGNGRGEQTPENQLLHLREWCSRCGHEVVAEYVEHRSGGKGRGERPEFDRMFQAAHQRRFDMVLCWALDRFSGSRNKHQGGELLRAPRFRGSPARSYGQMAGENIVGVAAARPADDPNATLDIRRQAIN